MKLKTFRVTVIGNLLIKSPLHLQDLPPCLGKASIEDVSCSVVHLQHLGSISWGRNLICSHNDRDSQMDFHLIRGPVTVECRV